MTVRPKGINIQVPQSFNMLLLAKCNKCGVTVNKFLAKKLVVHGHHDDPPTKENAWSRDVYLCSKCEEEEDG